MLCPSLLSPRALFLHGEEQWDAERRSLMHFALCSSCPYLPFCKAKIPSPCVTGLSYLQNSLLSSQGSRKSRIAFPACVPLPCQGHFFGGMWCWGFTGYFRWNGHRHCVAGGIVLRRSVLPPQGTDASGTHWNSCQFSLALEAEPVPVQMVQGCGCTRAPAEVKLHHCWFGRGSAKAATLPGHGIT